MHVPALLNLQEKLYINFAQLSRITDRNEYIHLNLLGLTIRIEFQRLISGKSPVKECCDYLNCFS